MRQFALDWTRNLTRKHKPETVQNDRTLEVNKSSNNKYFEKSPLNGRKMEHFTITSHKISYVLILESSLRA